MKLQLRHNSNSINHLFGLFTAIFIHGLIVATQFLSWPAQIKNQQVIEISFVAPSSTSQNQAFQNHSLPIKQNQEGDFYQKNRNNVQNQASNQQKQKNFDSQKTRHENRGLEKENANAQNSSQTEAIFDAAYLNNPSPIYPRIALNRGIEGKVLLLVEIKANGKAANISIKKSSGAKILDDAAIAAVSKWNFIPATRFNQNVDSQVIIPIEFKIS